MRSFDNRNPSATKEEPSKLLTIVVAALGGILLIVTAAIRARSAKRRDIG
jgi:hypothetical protein